MVLRTRSGMARFLEQAVDRDGSDMDMLSSVHSAMRFLITDQQPGRSGLVLLKIILTLQCPSFPRIKVIF